MKQFLIIIFLFITNQVIACLCHPMALEEEIEKCNYVFSGTVISQEGYNHKILIIDTWKGNLQDTIELRLVTSSCHLRNLELDKKYLIFLENYNSGIYNCSRTIEFEFSQDIDKLNQIFKNKKPQKLNWFSQNEVRFMNAVFANSNLDSLINQNDCCTFFIYWDYRNGYKILGIEGFIKYEHYGNIPLLVKINSKNNNLTLYAFRYWNPEFIKPKKYLRAFKRNKKDTGCNKS